MARAPRQKKKAATEQYTLLGILINRYEYRVEAGINTYLKMRPGMAGTSDPLYTYRTVLDIEGNCIYPEEREGEHFGILLVGDAHAVELQRTLADIQERDASGHPRYRTYRGDHVPAYERPKGITPLFRSGGARSWGAYLPVPPRLTSDFLIALKTEATPFLSLQEHKVGRDRWIDSLALQNTHPGYE
ncbi:hypothetical protein KG088_17820 [Halomonas sp. TRM85114]|uniref:hypothetical protein n=1 Tax=Halomonas jincaotanensis TaxID=2810616 RepID=UPI001BD31451|nr:hypothetical protein [Halomonas jincaotanensis]MBS9405465.1 hypothetical protein [Halomonas jincaotanensis]